MKKLLAVLAAVCVTGAAMLAIPAFGATRNVSVRDSVFSPKSLKVRKGTIVRWVWRGTRQPHNVHAYRGPQRFTSGRTQRRGSYSHRLTRRGTYRILCDVHAAGMRMTIKVR